MFFTDSSLQFAAAFHSAAPYPHVAIPDFFAPSVAAELAQQFPSPLTSKTGWFLYNNPIEIKFASNDRPSLPACFNSAIDILNSDQTRRIVSAISGVPFLEEVTAARALPVLLPSACWQLRLWLLTTATPGPTPSRRRHSLPSMWWKA